MHHNTFLSYIKKLKNKIPYVLFIILGIMDIIELYHSAQYDEISNQMDILIESQNFVIRDAHVRLILNTGHTELFEWLYTKYEPKLNPYAILDDIFELKLEPELKIFVERTPTLKFNLQYNCPSLTQNKNNPRWVIKSNRYKL